MGFLGFGNKGSALKVPPGKQLPPLPENGTGLDEYLESIASIIRYVFYQDDVPAVVLEAERGYPNLRDPLPPWGTPNIPISEADAAVLVPAAAGGLSEPLRPADAAAIDVPVFIGAGDRDVVVDPHAEPIAYPRSTDIQVFVLKGSGHMHNFAGSRAQLWYRLHAWGSTIAASKSR